MKLCIALLCMFVAVVTARSLDSTDEKIALLKRLLSEKRTSGDEARKYPPYAALNRLDEIEANLRSIGAAVKDAKLSLREGAEDETDEEEEEEEDSTESATESTTVTTETTQATTEGTTTPAAKRDLLDNLLRRLKMKLENQNRLAHY